MSWSAGEEAPPPPPPPLAVASSSSNGGTAVPADIPDCVLSELWAAHSDGVGSPLIDIYTETDCSSQVSDEEASAGGGVAFTELIEVIEDGDCGAVSGTGRLIWVVENDVTKAGELKTSRSSPPQRAAEVNCTRSAAAPSNLVSQRGRAKEISGPPRSPVTPKRRTPDVESACDRKSVPRSVNADVVAPVQACAGATATVEPPPCADGTGTVSGRVCGVSAGGDGSETELRVPTDRTGLPALTPEQRRRISYQGIWEATRQGLSPRLKSFWVRVLERRDGKPKNAKQRAALSRKADALRRDFARGHLGRRRQSLPTRHQPVGVRKRRLSVCGRSHSDD
ncbi:uncharacterized protein LOC122390988 isoform X3 [Amphibalanus amphitrite]|uniref:uncharacterized protein LOC122378055 isoform X2 n=1 Tax=Amphibalanus amphitrite TaxID=1232801 RepID=UPI001C9215A6|nr:uncharacterized protein LOC122378055 isoform X2 [Amphibalanus amphitrite]XP_043214697.1 uncharacterized protein LOC122378055 isoform X2 [Amphibalanus amphitrite]XP_043214698.1 uncharacterized protein LOC122378055 isoform X2 [Amphibalanus amphitrite]XP_043214699.1 uncharacterized protein LOC122378055 isoform X2 [Amphibalanus amphitrite]XP_043214700.1 uncharacterized protein LOC122378055 isoform X2 [Amphibalanus amphitrite]XP_043214701.1 uncharacterized protein LOC122378055 isoform X2 [Amphib